MTPLVQLAANALPGKRRYILIVGAGVSKDAGVPTAWDLMLKTAQLLYSGETGDKPQPKNWTEWFKSSEYASMRYEELIGHLYPTFAGQQAFLKDFLGGHKIGVAHLGIATLAQEGIIRAVITTNFDPYLEQALESVGITCQTLASTEDIVDSEPLIHCESFRVYKPHGTLGRGGLRNTPEDLKRLPVEVEDTLTQIATFRRKIHFC